MEKNATHQEFWFTSYRRDLLIASHAILAAMGASNTPLRKQEQGWSRL